MQRRGIINLHSFEDQKLTEGSMVVKRVYVGFVNENQDECFSELFKRFNRYGKINGDAKSFERHGSFGYISMEFENDSQFDKLKASFNRVKFKGNTLRVAEAKPDWKVRWELEKKDEERDNKKRKQMLKQEWEHYKKIENINMSWVDRKEVISGRLRTSARPPHKLRNITFRVNVNGKLKTYKCYKTKLWGYEKHKNLRDLVYKFTNNYWRSGTDHIVDKLDYSRTKSVSFRNKAGDTLTVSESTTSNDSESDNVNENEKENTNMVLASLLTSFDFEKPIAVEEEADNEEFGGAEYEDTAIYKESNFKPQVSASALEELKRVKEGEFAKAHNHVKTFDENEDEEENEEENEVTIPHQDNNDNQGDESSEEFIPIFGSTNNNNDAKAESSTNNTEVLRDLFNPSEPTSFKLIEESDEDIDHNKDLKEDEIAEFIPEVSAPQKSNNPLFFVHKDSPFLVGQTRLAKIKPPVTLDERLLNWEENFWDNRSSWTKEMKQRRRDVIRLNKRRQDKHRGNTLLI